MRLGLSALTFFLARAWWRGTVGVLEVALLAAISALCFLPVLRWFRGGMLHLPLGEGFAAMHLVYYVLPCLGIQEGLADYSASLRIKALMGVALYLAGFLGVYLFVVERKRTLVSEKSMLRREVNLAAVWIMFWSWVVLIVGLQFGLIPNFGSARNVFQSFLGAMGGVSVVCLFYRNGRGQLGYLEQTLAFVGLVVGVAASFVSGFLVGGAYVMGASLLAYTLGRKRVPVFALVFCVLLLGFLHLGKADYRTAARSEATGYTEAPTSFTAAYSLWFRVSWLALTESSTESSDRLAILERTSLIQLLAQAMETIPDKEPFLRGETYFMIPELLVPRVFWPDKPRGTRPTELLGIHLGIQSEEGSDTTGISVGAPAEGWMNFGWLGLAGAGVFLGAFFGFPASFSRQFEPQKVGWLVSSIFFVMCVDLEHSIPEMFCSSLQAWGVGLVVLLAISSLPARKPKPRTGWRQPIPAAPRSLP